MSTGTLARDFKIGKKIGEGQFGEIRLGKEANSKTTRALKFKNKAKLNVTETKNFKKEVKILSMMDHPNIVKLYEVIEEPKNYVQVQELCKGGELFDAICSQNKLKEVTTRTCVKQILQVVNYMHNKGITHRNLKPENILLSSDLDWS